MASVCFIQALKGLSHPTTSIRGNVFGMAGMAIAVVTTGALIYTLAGSQVTGLGYVLGGLVVGGAVGAYMAQRVEMTKMPELVAFMHSMIGLAAVFIAVAAAVEPWAFGITGHNAPIPHGNRLELALGAAIGAIDIFLLQSLLTAFNVSTYVLQVAYGAILVTAVVLIALQDRGQNRSHA